MSNNNFLQKQNAEYASEMTIDQIIFYLKDGASKYPNNSKTVIQPTLSNMIKGL
jgi:hypothetical protein